ncbi:hypothetical protein CDEST_11721 [Colletotrichum destructivum]|uniref:Uncharacterized protein n=1 Tax=Colletotrichum destructivum TaxID=34406 RepID=A0AAX4ITZ6_9PEZI|nr:hypothetical protein CDEST_11721 [Colletotrichum destructivum]
MMQGTGLVCTCLDLHAWDGRWQGRQCSADQAQLRVTGAPSGISNKALARASRERQEAGARARAVSTYLWLYCYCQATTAPPASKQTMRLTNPNSKTPKPNAVFETAYKRNSHTAALSLPSSFLFRIHMHMTETSPQYQQHSIDNAFDPFCHHHHRVCPSSASYETPCIHPSSLAAADTHCRQANTIINNIIIKRPQNSAPSHLPV